jgi:predicted dehydrogenase
MTCFNLRWHRQVRKAKTFIEAGRLGDITAVLSKYTHYRNPETAQIWHKKLSFGGGVSFNESVHHFDLWRFILGKEVEEVYAFHRDTDHFEDETSIISARLEDGILASCFNTFRTSPACDLEIVGTKGRLFLDLYRFDGFNFSPSTAYPGSISCRVKSILQSIRQSPEAFSAMRKGGGLAETFDFAWDHFVRCVIEDREPECSFDDGRQAVLTALAVVESFSTGRMTRVDEDNRLPN